MSEVISFREARCSRAASRSYLPETIAAVTCALASRASDQPAIVKEDVYRSILLLDIAAQRARLLVKEISDPSRRENFEAQITTIEQLLQIARQMASNL